MALADYQTYPRDFFTGSDTYILFNNKIVDQLIALQYNVQENIVPIYGYNSYTYDAVARGSRIVTGSFRINFVENMYLYTILELMSKDEEYSPQAVKTTLEQTLTAENISHLLKHGQISKIRDLINENEKRVWGEPGTEKIDKYRKPFFTSNVSDDIKKHGFDIIISFGDRQFHPGDKVDEIPSTVKVINGVQLTGVTQIIQPTGEPIYEEYTFIARDVDNTIALRK